MLSPFVFLRVSRNSGEAFLRRKSWFPLHRKNTETARQRREGPGNNEELSESEENKANSTDTPLCASFYNSSYQTLIAALTVANVVHAVESSILLLDYWKASAEKGGSGLGVSRI